MDEKYFESLVLLDEINFSVDEESINGYHVVIMWLSRGYHGVIMGLSVDIHWKHYFHFKQTSIEIRYIACVGLVHVRPNYYHHIKHCNAGININPTTNLSHLAPSLTLHTYQLFSRSIQGSFCP